MSTHRNKHNATTTPLHNSLRDALHVNGYHPSPRRSVTPNGLPTPANVARLMNTIEGDYGSAEDPRLSVFRDLYAKSATRLRSLYGEDEGPGTGESGDKDEQHDVEEEEAAKGAPCESAPSTKKTVRAIDEDDYDESDENEDDGSVNVSPLKSKTPLPPVNLMPSSAALLRGHSSSSTPVSAKLASSSSITGQTTEDVRKKLEEDKKATGDAAKRNFHAFFYTLENDRDTMLEQKKLEESERQVDIEMSGTNCPGTNVNGAAGGSAHQGTLSQTNLGASNLTLKNLIRTIDANRDKVQASDSELRALISEVRKNRSKWANEDKIGQEELYEAAEKVLNELKAMTEHSGPFLTKVNKKDAPDYGNIIKHAMDLGSMTKKLKLFHYKSKNDFVDDLNLIWSNCLKYNTSSEHFLRKKALFMRKETEKLVPLIPAIVVRDRAEVEAEERRLQNGDITVDGEDDSDDEPIISSRGRKAPGKTAKKGTNTRKAPAGVPESSPTTEGRPSVNHLAPNGLGSSLRNESMRADSESFIDGSQKDLSSPPPGTITPAGVNGLFGPGTLPDALDIDGESSINGMVPSVDGPTEEPENDDSEYKTWKEVTKKDRAIVTAERHRLFKNGLDPEEPALLRTKMGMRRWLRKQKQAVSDGTLGKNITGAGFTAREESQPSGETLAEGIEGEEERVLPDYYDTLSAIPDLPRRLRWVEDSTGNVQDPSDEFLRLVSPNFFTSPDSTLTKKIEENLRQIQSTRKLTSKIGVVKQMQLQSQMYQGQFQKHEPAPFHEQDIEPHVMSEDDPPIAPWVCRAALQRSTAKLLVHAGFEEFQPAALDTITDLAGDYFTKLARTLNEYIQAPQLTTPTSGSEAGGFTLKQRFTVEETILHTLQENGADLDALDSYVTEDVERAGTRLNVTHDRMKIHLAESLRPALNDAGPDGSNAFNDDSEQFVGGDFAEELGEDFFGFKELGLDQEFSLATLSVPLHLLQNRMRTANQAQNPKYYLVPYRSIIQTANIYGSALSTTPLSALPVPPPPSPITIDNVKRQPGLVQEFYLTKLHANRDQPLIEDDDLPQKQRFPKPRLPPTGKITSPRKRPPKEQGPGKGHPRKKLKLADGEAKEAGKDNEGAENGKNKVGVSPEKAAKKDDSKRLVNGTSNGESAVIGSPTPKGKGKEIDGGMISPESLEAS